MCVLTGDSDREVRDHAFKVVKGFLSKLEKVSEDPSLRECMGRYYTCLKFWQIQLQLCCIAEADVNTNATSSAAEVASTWAGWAVSAVASKFYKSQGSQIADSSPSVSGQVITAASDCAALVAAKADGIPKTRSEEPKVDPVPWGDIHVFKYFTFVFFFVCFIGKYFLQELSLSDNISEDKENGDGWEVDEEWAPIEDRSHSVNLKTKVTCTKTHSLCSQ